MHELTAGQRVGRLEVVRELGRGAFGRVYLASDSLLDRPVALKVVPGVPEATASHRARILREARAVGKLSSPHVVALYDLHEAPDGTWIFELEYVEGGTLLDLLANARPPAEDTTLRIARGIARALAVAHASGIVHGDVKPGNVLLDRAGEAKLTDFGFARLVGERVLSQTSERFEGTPTYMAPEVILGDPVSPASDVWAFGVVLYRLITGRLPFDARDWPALFFAVQHADPLPPGPPAPPDLARLALLCLSKRSADRPSSWEPVLRILDGAPRAAALLPEKPPPAKDAVLVGRERELEQLGEAVARVAGGVGACVMLSGPTGSGTTSLARAARDLARRNGVACIETTVTPLQGLVRPLLEATRRWIEGPLSGRLEEDRFGSAGGLARRLLEEPVVRFEPHGQTLWVVEHLLRQLSAERPLAVIIEDAEEAGLEDLKAIQHLQLRLPESPILLLVTCAHDRGAAAVAARLAEARGVVRVDVGPLTREGAHRLLMRVAEVGRVAPDVTRRILEVAQGNPLFTIELYRNLGASRIIAREPDPASPGRWALVPGPGWGGEAFPARLRDLYASRLAQLAEEDRVLLDAAAVDGTLIDGEALAALLNRPLLGVLRSLQRLYRDGGFVAPGPTGYRFTNATIREAIYHDLAPELRRALHLDFARHLEARQVGDRDPERIGLHWERGADAARARRYLRRAAAMAIARQEVARAIDLASRAGIEPGRIDAAEALAEADLILELADFYYGTGLAEQAGSLLSVLLDAAQADEALRLRALVHLALVRYYRGAVTDAEERDLRRAAEMLPPGREKGLASYLLGVMAKFRGELAAAEAHLRAADDVFRACGLDAPHSSALDQLASLALRQGRLREAHALYEDAARIAEHAGRRPNAAASRVNSALASLALGRLSGMTQALDRAIAEFEIEGALNLAAHARAHLGLVRFSEGDLDAALDLARDAADGLERNAHLPGLAFAAAVHAHVLAIRGRIEEAESALARSAGAARKVSARRDLERAEALRALCAACRGDVAEAAVAADAVAEQARLQDTSGAVPALLLAEAGAYFGAAPALREVIDRLPSARSEEALVETARVVGTAVVAGAGAAPSLLVEAATALRGVTGEGRAWLHALGSLLEARGRALAGDAHAAGVAAADGIDEARALGHVWLELRLLAELGRIAPSHRYAAEFATRLEAAAQGVEAGAARERLLAAWTGLLSRRVTSPD